MSIEITVETWPNLETLRHERIYPGVTYYYLDEYVGRLLLARSLGASNEGAIIHAQDNFFDDPSSLNLEKIRKICVPKAVIAQIMPWSKETLAVHSSNGEPALFTVQSAPTVVLTPRSIPEKPTL